MCVRERRAPGRCRRRHHGRGRRRKSCASPPALPPNDIPRPAGKGECHGDAVRRALFRVLRTENDALDFTVRVRAPGFTVRTRAPPFTARLFLRGRRVCPPTLLLALFPSPHCDSRAPPLRVLIPHIVPAPNGCGSGCARNVERDDARFLRALHGRAAALEFADFTAETAALAERGFDTDDGRERNGVSEGYFRREECAGSVCPPSAAPPQGRAFERAPASAAERA